MGNNIFEKAERHKNMVLNHLGGKDGDLLNVLEGHLANDSYRENSLNIFKRCISHNEGDSFTDKCCNFFQENIKHNFKQRLKKSGLGSLGYLAASLTFLANPFISVGISGATTLALGIAESREKRNVASIGHCMEHLTKYMVEATKELNEVQKDLLTDEAKADIEKNLKIKSPQGPLSTITRHLARASGAVVSGFRKLYGHIKNIPETYSTPFNMAFGTLLPFMPLLNTGMSYGSTVLRLNNIQKKNSIFLKNIEILFDPNSYNNRKDFDPDLLRKIFCYHMSKPFCELKSEFVSGDNSKNVKKAVVFLNWVGNRIRKWLPSVKGFETEDLTAPPEKSVDQAEMPLLDKFQGNELDREDIPRPMNQNIYIERFKQNINLLNDITNSDKTPYKAEDIYTTDELKSQQKKVEQIRREGTEFKLLKEENINSKTHYTWYDPRHDKDDSSHQITYIIDDATKEMEIIYGTNAQALIIHDADLNTHTGVRIDEIGQNNHSSHGDLRNKRHKIKKLSSSEPNSPKKQEPIKEKDFDSWPSEEEISISLSPSSKLIKSRSSSLENKNEEEMLLLSQYQRSP